MAAAPVLCVVREPPRGMPRSAAMRSLPFFIAAVLVPLPAVLAAERRPPNVVVILCDNLGNGDVACFNPRTALRTPTLDRMAAEGRRFTSFYSASGVCTPSRASLMTGCYPRRVGLHVSGIGRPVLQPVASRGLHAAEDTMADVLREAGYATACLGKWHLGDQPEFLPTRHGFETFLGIPYSEDMVENRSAGRDWPPLPLIRDETVIEAPAVVETLLRRLTDTAIRFIAAHRHEPFFIYFPAPGPGSRDTCYPGPAFRGRSAGGLYGDAIEELDWSAGRILEAIRDNGLDEHTLVIWTSDNGAPRRNPPQGSNAPYRGMGYTTSEGGQRVPCIARWPGRIPAGTTCTRLCSMMDLTPTIAAIGGGRPPRHPVDGHDIRPLLFGPADARSPYDDVGFCYYDGEQLQAVREGDWKLYLPLAAKRGFLDRGAPQELALYDVEHDVPEDDEASARHPGIVSRLLGLAEDARRTIGDVERPGAGQREAGHVEHPTPRELPPR